MKGKRKRKGTQCQLLLPILWQRHCWVSGLASWVLEEGCPNPGLNTLGPHSSASAEELALVGHHRTGHSSTDIEKYIGKYGPGLEKAEEWDSKRWTERRGAGEAAELGGGQQEAGFPRPALVSLRGSFPD